MVHLGPTDEWGVPANMFGYVPADFIATVGRVVMVGALIEYMFAHVVASVAGKSQVDVAGLSMHELRRALGKAAQGRVFTERVVAVVAETEALMRDRNAIVHSRWPFSGDGPARGWRPRRASRSRPPTADTTEWIEYDVDEMRELVRRMVANWTALQALMSSGDLNPPPS